MLKNAALVLCVFCSVFLTIYMIITVANKHNTSLAVLVANSVAITATITHCMGVW